MTIQELADKVRWEGLDFAILDHGPHLDLSDEENNPDLARDIENKWYEAYQRLSYIRSALPTARIS